MPKATDDKFALKLSIAPRVLVYCLSGVLLDNCHYFFVDFTCLYFQAISWFVCCYLQIAIASGLCALKVEAIFNLSTIK